MGTQLYAGARKIVITPPVGVDLCGWGPREGPSIGVHDDLCAAALYLRSEVELLVITADLIGLDAGTIGRVRAGIEQATGIPGGQIMIGCSHTHSGPATPAIAGLGRVDADYMAVLERKLSGLGQMAREAAEPAALGCLREPVQMGINRRVRRGDTTVIDRNEKGVVAPYVDVVAVDSMAGTPLARLFVHAAHPVTLRPDNLRVSADWPGYAQRTVEAVYGEGCVALFGQGCCGNINSDGGQGYEVAEKQGRMVAGAVIKAAECADKQPAVTLGAASEQLLLPCQDPPPVAEAEALLAQLRQQAAAEGNWGIRNMRAGDVVWGERLLALAQQGARGLTVAAEVQALRLGDFALVGLPGEVFVEYALALDTSAPFAQTATMGYANGCVGYVPTAAAFAEGGYEVTHAIRFYGDTMLTPACEDLLVGRARHLLRELQAAGTPGEVSDV